MADTEVSSVVSDFIGFLNASPTAFHAVGNLFLLHFLFGGSLTYSSPFNIYHYILCVFIFFLDFIETFFCVFLIHR